MKTIILPGMGADSNLYPKEQYKHLKNVLFADWPAYDGENTLEAMAQKVMDQHHITRNMIVGGSSFGGMVAIEIAKKVGINKVILIGSATHPGFINPWLQKMKFLTDIISFEKIQGVAGVANRMLKSDLLYMFEKSDSKFLKSMCMALFDWEGLGTFNGEVCHIHGERDRIIFPPQGNVEIIPKGGHLIALTHSEEVSKFIDKNR
jgi:pimeloyl-ACP methyl ester carboxylesterase